MKILVLSDSHSTLSFMRRCIESVKPDAIIHLGDHFDDGIAMKEEYKMFGLEFGIGKALLNMLDLGGVRYVCADSLDERLATSLRFITKAWVLPPP